METPLLRVTDLSSYIYCPRQFYLQKVKGLRKQPTKPMVEGLIRHQVRESFANKEPLLMENLEQINTTLTKQATKSFYQEFLNNIIQKVFAKNQRQIYAFKITPSELTSKIQDSMTREIQLRAEAIDNTLKKGFTGKALWENLEPKHISEMPLVSEKLGLKGRADRVTFTKDEIIPFELKTRETDKIWPSDEIQLIAYAMLLEEEYKQPIPKAVLEAGNTLHELQITDQEKKKVTDLIEEIKFMLRTGKPKHPASFAKCQSCDWEEECASV